MIQNVRIHDTETPGEMEHLAQKLINRLGVEDALLFCRDNHWDGIRQIIQRGFANDDELR